jgi:single-strand DNA-binding protein
MEKTMTINEVILAGRLARDPDMRYAPQTGTGVCNFTVALDRYMGKDRESETDFIPCVAFGETAKFVEKYFAKGRKIIVKGNIRVRSWEDNEGKKRWATEVWTEKVDFADSPKKNNGNGSKAVDYASPPPFPGEHVGDEPPKEPPKQKPTEQTAAASTNNNMPPWYQG